MKPNVIFFMVDQMGAKWLEEAMNGICDLPNLSRLQSMGVTFSKRSPTTRSAVQPGQALPRG